MPGSPNRRHGNPERARDLGCGQTLDIVETNHALHLRRELGDRALHAPDRFAPFDDLRRGWRPPREGGVADDQLGDVDVFALVGFAQGLAKLVVDLAFDAAPKLPRIGEKAGLQWTGAPRTRGTRCRR